MTTAQKNTITIEATVSAPVEKVWKYWTEVQHITKWNNASDDWHSPSGVNDVRQGGTFSIRMEAKDGSEGFDFAGTYDTVKPNELIEYTLGDDRKVKTVFTRKGNTTHIAVTFETENMNSPELQRDGWQAILDNFKKYTEEN